MKINLILSAVLFLALILLPMGVQIPDLLVKGQIRVLDEADQKIYRLSYQDYLIAAVAAEIPADYHEEALKAQVVVIHTNTLRNMSINRNQDYDVSVNSALHQGWMTSDQLKQTYGGSYDTWYAKIKQAVEEVANEVILYRDKPIVAAYHAISGGKTESALNIWGESVEYLQSVVSEGDRLAPNFQSKKLFTTEQVRSLLLEFNPSLSLSEITKEWLICKEQSESGTVLSVAIGEKMLTGQQIRGIFSLPSANFQIELLSENFIFTTYGQGHGVGLSQYGADFYARQGWNYQQILQHYYPNTELARQVSNS